MDELHKKKYIKTYFYEYKIYNEDEIYLFLGLEDNFENDNKYKFIKPMIIPYTQNIKLKWGMTFQNIILYDYGIPYEKETKVELDINYGCLLGNSEFKEYFKNYLKYHGISLDPKRYEKDYYVYFFQKNMTKFNVIKNINLNFYHKELNFNFSFNYDDLILEKDNGYYFLIAFEYGFQSNWKFGFPFFKKYHFIFNHDSKIMGFYCPNGCSDNMEDNENYNKSKDNIDDNKNDNNYNNSLELNNNNNENKDIRNKKENKLNFKMILIIFLGIIFAVIIILFFGICIGKKLFGVRKNKVNELLELYDYSSSNSNKENNKKS